MRSFVFSFLLLLCSAVAYSQSLWQEYSQVNGVKFYVQDASCTWEQSPVVAYKFIKVANTTLNRVRVSYQLEIQYGNACNGCDGSDEYRSDFILEAGAEVEGGCDSNFPARLDILVSNPNLPTLQFLNFTISAINVDWIE